MSSEDSKSAQIPEHVKRKKNELQMKVVFDTVSRHKTKISMCRGKHVIIIVGTTQVGKSTLINALRFGKLKKKAKGRGMFEYSLPDGVEVPKDDQEDPDWCEIGNGTGACTKYPCAHRFGDNIVVDTRGFFDDRLEGHNDAVSSILMEMIVREAKSVKLVLLIRCSDLFRRALGMGEVGKVFGKIVTSDDEPVLFLFNDYPETPGEMKDMTPQQKQSYIMQQIRKEVEDWKAEAEVQETKHRDKLKEAYSKAGASDIDVEEMMRSDRNYRTVAENRRYLHIMANALDKTNKRGCISYIEPSDDHSISMLKEEFSYLPSMNKHYLKFEGYSDDVLQFRKYIAECTESHVCVLYGEKLLQKYPPALITKLLALKKKNCDKHKQVLQQLNSGDKECIKQHGEEYECGTFKSKAKEIEKEEKDLAKQLGRMMRDQDDIENEKPQVFYEDSWAEGGIAPKDHIVRYPPGGDVPYDHVEVLLHPETKQSKIVSTRPEDFEIHYTSSRSVGKILKGVSGCIIGGGGVVFSAMGNPAAGFTMAWQGGTMIGSALGKVNGGVVRFFVHPKYFPENAQKLKRIGNASADLMRRQAVLNARRNLLLKSSTDDLLDKVQNALNIEEDELKVLEDFVGFCSKVHKLYQKRVGDMKQLYAVIAGFYPNEKSFSDFMSLYKEVFNGNVVPETDENTIPLSDLDITDLAQTMLRLFPDV